ncbi:MAG: imidazole glycerol phosphate synthase subunit HisH [Ktedonobacteraceae bacterium]
MIAIIDYGAGNIRSIEKALEHVGAQVQITDDANVVAQSQAIVLPGVGSGGSAMARITECKLDEAIREATLRGKPFLGICLGMQLLADHHAEGEVAGLRLFRGEVRRIPHGPKIPHMGWNQITALQAGLPIFADIPPDAYFYFAHSYYVEPQDQQGVAALTDYGSPYCSVIATEQVWGTQFHPEKSGAAGMQLLKNFVKWVHKK